ncbi:MAG TPA: pyridoxal phosphate-dependent aminotransferase [Sphingomicrobium sp.]|nr:pyridoxal phosphate-dependent aminotransferase [Sphingomicrobium sp.]
MRSTQSDYMHWAKFKPPVRYALTTSEVPHFRMDSLPITIADLELDGASHPRFAPLRERIADRYGVLADQVVTADGTSMANFLAMATLIAPGDEVLVEKPTYELLLDAASFLGASIRRFDRKASDAFRLDPAAVEQALTVDTRLIIITNLHNPSSVLAAEDELRQIGELADRVGARVLVDEVYLDSASGAARPRSAVHLGPTFLATNSLTKVYGLSGLRCGWVLAEPKLVERMWRLNDLFGVNQAHQAERLGCIAFDHLDEVIGDNPSVLEYNRSVFNQFVSATSGIDCAPARHGITAFPRWHGGDTQRLDDLLRQQYDASVVPGRWFEFPEHFRIGFGLPKQDFEAALERLGAAMAKL